MQFEFDSRKSASNREKHGIDFPGAQALWDDPDRIEIPARTEDEPRLMVIGRIGVRVWSAVITYRGDNVRLISARPANRKEVELYEGEGV
jgi:uncharacterized DUF497 family protein